MGADARPHHHQSLGPGGRGCALPRLPQRNRRRHHRRRRRHDGERGRRGDPVAGRTPRADVPKPPRRRDTPRRPCHWEPFRLSKYPGRFRFLLLLFALLLSFLPLASTSLALVFLVKGCVRLPAVEFLRGRPGARLAGRSAQIGSSGTTIRARFLCIYQCFLFSQLFDICWSFQELSSSPEASLTSSGRFMLKRMAIKLR